MIFDMFYILWAMAPCSRIELIKKKYDDDDDSGDGDTHTYIHTYIRAFIHPFVFVDS